MKFRPILALAATASIALAACSGGATPAPATPEPPVVTPAPAPGDTAAPSTAPEPAEVRLQLQWVPQAQFAGYFAAEAQGYFAAEGLTVTIIPGGPDVIPQVAGSAPDGPEFTLSWVPKVLEARAQGSDLVNIAQIFQRSGTLSVSWADSGISGPADFAGKKIGVWDFGNEFEVTAGALGEGLVAGTDYEKVIQPFDMSLLLNRQIDVAEAMIYNEYAQVLETINPATGNLYQPEDLNVINWNDYRVGMLQDAIFARQSWLSEGNNRDVAVRFVRASLNGWIYCRDNPDDCIQYTVDAGSTLGTGHQRWMMNEINALIWPSPAGIGEVDPISWADTIKVSLATGIIAERPDAFAYVSDIVREALAGIDSAMDTTGAGFTKGTVEVTAGGN
ncbi:MAG: transporter substrate-binding protein [Chloroflexi bacterium]|nr:transporter substrate-binding protein [Chloroflexota bacterium]